MTYLYWDGPLVLRGDVRSLASANSVSIGLGLGLSHHTIIYIDDDFSKIRSKKPHLKTIFRCLRPSTFSSNHSSGPWRDSFEQHYTLIIWRYTLVSTYMYFAARWCFRDIHHKFVFFNIMPLRLHATAKSLANGITVSFGSRLSESVRKRQSTVIFQPPLSTARCQANCWK